MSKLVSLQDMKANFMQDPEFAAAYAEADAEYSVIEQMLRARAAAGLTQEALAERLGTTQSAIARLESGTARHSPSLATLQRYAKALGYRVEVRFVKQRGLTSKSS